jgi:hypothetical protein
MRTVLTGLFCFVFFFLITTPFQLFSQHDLDIKFTSTVPVIDGVIDQEWNNHSENQLTKILTGNSTTAADFSAYFKATWDQENLYVLTVVTDDVKINDSGEVWQDDAIEIYIDGDNSKMGSYDGINDLQYTFRWNDETIHGGNPTGVQFKITGTPTGYILEVKFPWTTLGVNAPANGTLIGLDVHVHDDDDGNERDNKLAWFTSDDNSWNNPSLFATAMLAKPTGPIGLYISSTNTAPVIDGTMDELWANQDANQLAKVLAGGATTPADLSAYFKSVWDKDNLYVLVNVTDDVKMNDSGNESWKDDLVEIYLDINNDKRTTYGANDYQISFRWNDPTIRINNGTVSGIEFKMVGTPTGYILEVKFPWVGLGLTSPKSGVMLGFDLQIWDDDNGGDGDNKIGWHSSTDNAWQDPSLFGIAQLIGDIAIQYPADAPRISVQRGFFTNPFDVTITSAIQGMNIYYTLDGSDPATSSTASILPSPATVRIDPDNTDKRGKTLGVVLRTRARKDGYSFSPPVSRTYLFLNKISDQTQYPGHNWPNYDVNGQIINLLVSPRILNDNRYKNLITPALLEVPTISIITDQSNLFDPSSGIYVNALNARGIEWERPASIELINPNGADGFQIDAGIRIRGGYSRNNFFQKHAFRLFFRRDYGEGKLNFPLFEDEGVKSFDKMDLRCAQNYSWAMSRPWSESPLSTFTRDVFSRDLQREMGNPYTRSRFYQLYINGLYWGLYQTQERSEARYAASYFGGSDEDYDVIKRAGNAGHIEATDGNTDAWREIWNLCQSGFSTNSNYYKIQGFDATGKRDPSVKVLVDIDNLIDYMNVIFYTGNFDAPVSSWMDNKGPNNFYAIYNRNDNNVGFKFFAHDNEHTLVYDNLSPGFGVNEDRVSIGSRTDNLRMEVNGFDQFHPQWLHFKLSQNAEYRQRFSDRSYKDYYNKGIFTPAQAQKLFLSRTYEIDTAIIGESLRWGDAWDVLYTKDDHWVNAVNQIVNLYFPARTNIVINQLKTEGLLSNVNVPVFRVNNNPVLEESILLAVGNTLNIQNSHSSGSIKYTTNGTDPRLAGGTVSQSAVDGGNQLNIQVLQTTIINARIFANGNWSPIRTLKVIVDTKIEGLQITEIHYNPLNDEIGGISGQQFEFIELKNSGNKPINLTACSFVNGISYTFNTETIVLPGSFVVLASSSFMFNQRYGFSPHGEYDGQLDNGGERVTLASAAGDTLISIRYNDKAPWPTSADGLGFSIVPAVSNVTADWNDGNNWRASAAIGGSPNANDPDVSIPQILVNEVLANTEQPSVDAIELYNPNNFAVNVSGWYLSDNRKMPTKWKIPNGTTIPANGYKVFYQGHYQNNNLVYTANEFGSAFAFSSNGDEAYIFSANSAGALTGYEHGYDFRGSDPGVSFGRHIISTGKDHFVAQAQTTLNQNNSYPRVGPVVISQIMYNPSRNNFEFMELVNTSANDVELYDKTSMVSWKVEGIGFDFPMRYVLKAGKSVYLVESAIHPNDFRFMYNIDPSIDILNYPGKLDNSGEDITLFKSGTPYVEENELKQPYTRIDKVSYNDNELWPDADGNGYTLIRKALTLYGNDPANWIASPPLIKINTVELVNAIEGVAYNQTVTASGGTAPYSWSIISGSLPQGLSLNPITGVISGLSTQKGNFNLTIKVEDQLDGTHEMQYQLEVIANTLPVAVNDNASTTLNISAIINVIDNDTDNDGDKWAWQVSVSQNPAHGEAIVNSDKTITYTPAKGYLGNDQFTYRVTDYKGSSQAQVFITIENNEVITVLERRILMGSDDAEQNLVTNEVLTVSTDIDLTYDADYSREQVIGLRFQNIGIAKSDRIISAYIQFSTDKVSTGAANLQIHGEKRADPVTYTAEADIRSRSKTTAVANWQPENWTIVGEEGEKQRTTDLTTVIQEILNQPGWVPGNSMSFIISGTGTHMAQSYERNPATAPKLVITYSNVYEEASVPFAIIKSDPNFKKGVPVHLDGSSSNSSDGKMLNYYWQITQKPSGSLASLSNSRIVNPTFTPDLYGTYRITLSVDNGVNESNLATKIIVLTNSSPIANAGTDQSRAIGSLVVLNGSGSNDPDGDPITYSWALVSKPAGSAATLSNPTVVNPSFTADREGLYTIRLIVSDGLIQSAPDDIVVSVNVNRAPIANAGTDQQIILGATVTFNGTNSSDPEGDNLTYNWSIVSRPNGSTANITNQSAARPTLLPDVAGTYTVRLVVNDGSSNSQADEVVITVIVNREPIASAGENQQVQLGSTVQLNGSSSYDPEGMELIFQWSFVTRPANSSAALVNQSSSTPTFVPDMPGAYSIKLRVSDGTFTTEDEVQITVLPVNVSITKDISRSLKVYPNPFNDKLVVDYYSPEKQKVTFSLSTVTGAVIHKYEFVSEGLNTHTLWIDDQQLTPGIYLLLMKPEKGEPRAVKLNYTKRK